MEDACHINFLIDFAHRKVSGSVVEYRSAVSEGLRFDCGLIIFSLFHALDRMKNIFLYFFLSDVPYLRGLTTEIFEMD